MQPLTSAGFFKYFIFHPNDKALSRTDQRVALVASVIFGILTLGIGHLICRLFFYDRTFTINPKHPIPGDPPHKKNDQPVDPQKGSGGIARDEVLDDEFERARSPANPSRIERSIEERIESFIKPSSDDSFAIAEAFASLAEEREQKEAEERELKVGDLLEKLHIEHIETVTKSKEALDEILRDLSVATPTMVNPEEALGGHSAEDMLDRVDEEVVDASGDEAPLPLPVSAKGWVELQSASHVQVNFGEIAIHVKNSGDLCAMPADAIVNAANEYLLVNSQCGGVCKAIYQKGGLSINDECQNYLQNLGKKKVEAGHAMITGGGTLAQAKHVVHAVGPRWDNKDSETVKSGKKEALYNAYYNSCLRAHEKGLNSIIFPSIGTGIFGFPLSLAGPIAVQAFKDFALNHPSSSLKEITLIAWDSAFAAYTPCLIAAAE